ncbi:hypothetical protein ACROYT_G033777 [Oculina patagonica]
MKAQSVFFHVNMKAIFCLALVTALTNLVFTQNLYTSPLDDTRNALMSFSSGASSPKPTTSPPLRPGVAPGGGGGGGWGWSGWSGRRRRRSGPFKKSDNHLEVGRAWEKQLKDFEEEAIFRITNKKDIVSALKIYVNCQFVQKCKLLSSLDFGKNGRNLHRLNL